MRNIVIIGSSGHAGVVIDAIERAAKYRIVGIIDSFKAPGDSCLGYPVLGSEALLPGILAQHDVFGGIVAIGDNWTRYKMVTRIRSAVPDFRFVTAIHPSAEVALRARVGDGSVLLAGATVCASATVGEFCILNTRSSLDHDGVMGSYASLAPAATTGGRVTIKPFAAVMLGANIIDSVSIGEHAVIGVGSIVLQDIPDLVVAYGQPARIIRARQPGDPYFGRTSQCAATSEQ